MEPRDELVEHVVARGPAIFIEVGDEVMGSADGDRGYCVRGWLAV